MTAYIDEQVERILLAYDELRQTAVTHHLTWPVIYGGIGVFLSCAREQFRPDAVEIAADLDLLIRIEEAPEWEKALEIPLHRIDRDSMHGWSGKQDHPDCTLDLLAVEFFAFPHLDPQYRFTFDLLEFPPEERRWRGRSYPVLHPALHAAFKLLLWRGREQGKFDAEDFVALVLSNPVSAEDLGRALGLHPESPLHALLKTRIQTLVPRYMHPRLVTLAREF